MRRLINDPSEPLWAARHAGSALRSGAVRARLSISEEGWRYDRPALSSDPRWRDGPRSAPAPPRLVRLIEDSLRNLAAFSGAAQENLTRNYAWRFLELGRRIERGSEIALVGHGG